MYCKECGKEYPKKSKMCKKCGIALSGGAAPITKNTKSKKVIIISVVVGLLVAAALLTVGLVGLVPDKITGTWYEVTGNGPVFEFKSFGKLIYSSAIINGEGTYQFDNATGLGMVDMQNEDFPPKEFTCDGATLEWDSMTFSREFVERFDFKGVLDQAIGEVTKDE